MFNTALSGYQEVLSDPSYAGQIITFTNPHIGNYGVNATDFEARGCSAAASWSVSSPGAPPTGGARATSTRCCSGTASPASAGSTPAG